ncbi:helix-turn-helix domain-containing protein [Weissella paramesenteroides]|uniref:helix-turn-helix domain-containing protein n=1 Tax=Weissella paramesenteroides TaxID=1249 RepID=UPI0012395B76|nr:helix-turn-helix domain-containing protein [Weissella paramesenteroides]KAA8456451.1 helix-turn-helix domain-containing protein [Weissella paramesenteroides]KAA8456605.1 helix-turn-helix domain-containing protein [Weissella paramesenteroides]KAA8459073.1 helix-turn-helix domain-containing protein [Weissella paramesenteroides]KAA8463479.1 helix-turn-helix domain-containing protein [Weissella paramesenteroides]KAA8465530.1 helix-turn-helix domain-containing protein [Weissella paramesenteroide
MLAVELKLSDEASLKGWVNLTKKQGLEALAFKHHKSCYNLEFKLKVVEYYQTHVVGVSKVTAVFNISASQVYSWARAFKLGGLATLISRQKGRPSLMKKKPVKSTHQ